jgi:hypothetical protein
VNVIFTGPDQHVKKQIVLELQIVMVLMLPVVFHQRGVIQDVSTASIPTQVILVNTNVFMELQYERLMVSGNVPVISVIVV